ncbi:MAG: hypothetical protein ACLFUZ_00170 [Candidatus Micrarchaeia archaeon]
MKIPVFLAIASVFLLSGCPSQEPSESTPLEINSFEECAAAGYPVMESYPERCNAPGVGTFTRVLSDEECQNADIDYCFATCRVCPPCPECSSLGCRSAEFCESMGFTEEWHESIKAD